MKGSPPPRRGTGSADRAEGATRDVKATTGRAPSSKASGAAGTAAALLAAGDEMSRAIARLRFAAPVTHVYRPLEYAAKAHAAYVERYGSTKKRVLFLGMNPGPFGMAQTGIPFGDVASVRDWLGIETSIDRPVREHPSRPVLGFACARGEVSGARLWGLLAQRFGTPARFFADHFVANYCPLLFLEESGRNRTPDRLGARERELLFSACDRHLARIVEILAPEVIVGIGRFAADRARIAIGDAGPRIVKVLHPSPASPIANRGWERQVVDELRAAGVWTADAPAASAAAPARTGVARRSS